MAVPRVADVVRGLEEKHADLQAAFSERVMEVNAKTEELEELERRLAEARQGSQAMVGGLEAELAKRRTEVTQLNKVKEQLIDELNTKTETKEDMERRIAARTAELDRLRKEISEQEATISALQDQATRDSDKLL